MDLNFTKIKYLYWCFICLRILLVFFPQIGYIHPDEFFQTVEVLAGKFLQLESRHTWEFNSTNPIRGIIVPYFAYGISFKSLQAINFFARNIFGIEIITSYSVLIAPRLFTCFASFLIDYSLYKICDNNNVKYFSKLFILSTSYVVIIYGTRTFNNTIELIFFSLLLHYVSQSMIHSTTVIKKKEYVQYRYTLSSILVEKAKLHKLQLFLKVDTLQNCGKISAIVVLGVFTRPTFLVYALMPVFFWLYRGLGSKCVYNLEFHLRMLALLIYSVPTLLFGVIVDSFFYGYITWGEIGMLDVSLKNFVFTPYNFIMYNSQQNNLLKHASHPYWLHFAINMPLLFNILAVFAFATIMDYLQKMNNRQINYLPTIRSVKGMMVLSTITPLIILSSIVNQQKRFLIPLILPMVYLYANKILSEKSDAVQKTTETNEVNLHQKRFVQSNKLLYLWLIINFTLGLFDGFIHQAGVIPVLSHISKKDLGNHNITYNIISSHTYMLPKTFLVKRKNSPHKSYKKIILYEQGGKDLRSTINLLNKIYKFEKSKSFNLQKKSRIHFMLPSSLDKDFNKILRQTNISYKEKHTFYPHFCGEALPDFRDFFNKMSDIGSLNAIKLFFGHAKEFFTSFGLTLYRFM